jgi:hypothetical protein
MTVITAPMKYVGFCDVLGFSSAVLTDFDATIALYRAFRDDVRGWPFPHNKWGQTPQMNKWGQTPKNKWGQNKWGQTPYEQMNKWGQNKWGQTRMALT